MTPLVAAQLATVALAAVLGVAVVRAALRGRGAAPTTTAGLLLILALSVTVTLLALPPWVLRDAWLAGFAAVLATYPDGRFVPGWTRWLLAAAVMAALADALTQGLLLNGAAAPALLGGTMVVLLACQVHRYRRRSTVDERTRVRWPVLFVCWTAVGFWALTVLSRDPVGAGTGWPAAIAAGLALLPAVGLVIGYAHPQLADVDRLLRDTVRWLVVAAATVAAWLAARAVAGAAGWQGLADAAAAGAAVAAALAASRPSLLLADRFVGPAKPDPVRVLTALGERYEQSLDADELARSIAATILDALQLTDVEVSVAGLGGEPGDPATVDGLEILEVVYQGEAVGAIRFRPRLAEPEITAHDREFLRLIATHAGPAMHAVRVVADLRRAREQLVLAREEERRRLRRNLHDDLAPELAGLALSSAAVSRYVMTEPARALELAGRLADDLRRASQHVREIAYDLRPPVLDDLGLTAAIADRMARGSENGGPTVIVDAPDERLELPAAVELAALRIVQEAVANARKHGRARECRVLLRLEGRELRLEITDDGHGFADGTRKGVGLRSIEERAAELGGTSAVRSSPGGTSVLVRLPVALEAGA